MCPSVCQVSKVQYFLPFFGGGQIFQTAFFLSTVSSGFVCFEKMLESFARFHFGSLNLDKEEGRSSLVQVMLCLLYKEVMI